MQTMVGQRRRELALRMALGAPPAALLRMVLRRGLTIAAVGTILGLLGVFLVNRLLRAVLYQVSPTDTSTLGIVAGLLLGVAALASFLPARSGTRSEERRVGTGGRAVYVAR